MQTYRGMTFSEILVCFILLSITLLCVNQMQYIALRETKSAFYASIAIEHINSVIEQPISLTIEQKKAFLTHWHPHIKANLPNGDMQLNPIEQHYQLGIVWGKKHVCKNNLMELSGCLTLKDIF